MITDATKAANLAGLAIIVGLFTGCDSHPYRTLFKSTSPDGQYIAYLKVSEEGTLGTDWYKLEVVQSGKGDAQIVMEGDTAAVSAPVWSNSSELIVPFCFGSINSIKSVLPYRSKDLVEFRGKSSDFIRVHFVTAPDTMVAGKPYCSR